MLKIDTHQHFWHYDPVEYGWIGDAMQNIRRDFLPADLEREISKAGVQGVLSVQARQSLLETEWLLDLAAHSAFIWGVVGWVPLIDPGLPGILEKVIQNPKLKSVRHVLQDEPDPLYMLRDDFNAGIRALKSAGLAYDVLILEQHLPQTIQFVDRHPNQLFIVDHLAKPKVSVGELSPWRERMQELSKRENVYCKISGLATEADYSSWNAEQLAPYMDHVLETFGPKRTMFGSDWPVCLVAIKYEQWISVVSEALGQLTQEEQVQIWSGTAKEAYNLSLDPGY